MCINLLGFLIYKYSSRFLKIYYLTIRKKKIPHLLEVRVLNSGTVVCANLLTGLKPLRKSHRAATDLRTAKRAATDLRISPPALNLTPEKTCLGLH